MSNRWKCAKCGARFATQAAVASHIGRMHGSGGAMQMRKASPANLGRRISHENGASYPHIADMVRGDGKRFFRRPLK